MRFRAAVVAVLTLLLSALTGLAAGPASAGGPTSVLLASPAAGAAAGLYTDDPGYAELSELLGGYDLPTSSAPDRPSDGNSPYVTATWLIHDVTVWRIDRIFLMGPDDVWVASQASYDEPLTGAGMFPGESGSTDAIWHRPTDTDALIALLTDLGVVAGAVPDADGGRPAAVADPVTGDPAGSATGDDPAPALTASSADTPASSPWWWALAGLVGGLALAGGAGWVLTLRRRARTAPTGDKDPVPMIPV